MPLPPSRPPLPRPPPLQPPTSTTKSTLLTHSRYIRDTLAPHLALPNTLVTPTELQNLKTIFASLSAIPMTVDLLRYSRIEKALAVIAGGGGAWPADASLMAEALLASWEEGLAGKGGLKAVRADLWGVGGRLEGCRKVKVGGWRDEDMKRRGSDWSIEFPVGASLGERAYEYGDLGFQVGHWWLKLAAAFRDGMIDNQHHSIISDAYGAYAIHMEGNQESPVTTELRIKEHCGPTGSRNQKSTGLEKWSHNIESVDRQITRFTPRGDDPGIAKLRKESLTRNAVRVLRSAKMTSPLAPKAGLRYDGLYRIIGYSVKLETTDHKDRWLYTFQLARQTDPPQDPMETALAHPTADEMDDWKDYQREKAREKGLSLLSLRWGESLEEKKRTSGVSDDSGYFSLSSDWGRSLLRGEIE